MNVKKFLNFFFLIISFVFLSFLIDHLYRSLWQTLIEAFFKGRLYFTDSDFNIFATYLFIISFVVYCLFIVYCLKRISKGERLFSLFLLITLFFATTITSIYLAGSGKLITCTVCNDNTLGISYTDINSDRHFLMSSLISLIPLLILVRRSNNIKRDK